MDRITRELVNNNYLEKYWYVKKDRITYIYFKKAGAAPELFAPSDYIDVHDPQSVEIYESLLNKGFNEWESM